jgi:hypothetical protein
MVVTICLDKASFERVSEHQGDSNILWKEMGLFMENVTMGGVYKGRFSCFLVTIWKTSWSFQTF